MRARVLVRTQFANCVGPQIYLSGPPRKRLDQSAGPWQPWWPRRDIYGYILEILKGRIKTFLWMLPFLPLASSAMLWIRLSRDFRNQLSKQLYSRNSSPAVFIFPGLLSGSSPKHLNPAHYTVPHKNRARLIVLPHIKTGDTVSTLNHSLQSVKWIWGWLLILRRLQERGPDPWVFRLLRTSPLEVERLTPDFMVPVSLRCPQGTSLPTLPPCVLQGAAVSGERMSQGPPGNVVALRWPPLWGGFQSGQFRRILPVHRFRTLFCPHKYI